MEQKDKIMVSVCISVHNTAKYLPRCLDSVCAQTLKSLEIVLVNNGSTDNSEDIMHQYANQHKDRTFIIISQEDKSLAGGRQTGINHATGEYITFLDADDLVEPTAYQKMSDCAEKENVDIVEIQTRRDGQILESSLEGVHDSHQVLKQYLTIGGIQSMLWMRLYRRSLFDKPVMPSIYTNNEDMFAWPCLLYAAHSIYFLKEVLHTYSTDNDQGVMLSETNNPELAERRFNSRTKALLFIPHFRDYIGEEGMSEYEKELPLFTAKYILGFLLTPFIGKSMREKEDAVVSTLNFKDTDSLIKYLNKWLPKGRFNTFSVYHHFGLNAAFAFNRLIHKQ